MRFFLNDRQVQILIAGGELYYDSQKVTATPGMIEHLKRMNPEVAAAYIVPDNIRGLEPGYRVEIGLRGRA